MLSMQAGGKTRLITISSGNMHTIMSFFENGSDRTKRLADLESVSWSKVKAHIHMPEAFWLSTSDIKASSLNCKQKMCVQCQANILQRYRRDMKAEIAKNYESRWGWRAEAHYMCYILAKFTHQHSGGWRSYKITRSFHRLTPITLTMLRLYLVKKGAWWWTFT